MPIYPKIGMVYSGLHRSRLILVSLLLLAGCAGVPVNSVKDAELEQLKIENQKLREFIEQSMRMNLIKPADKPYKVCPQNPQEKDYPCVKMGPTAVPADRGELNDSVDVAYK